MGISRGPWSSTWRRTPRQVLRHPAITFPIRAVAAGAVAVVHLLARKNIPRAGRDVLDECEESKRPSQRPFHGAIAMQGAPEVFDLRQRERACAGYPGA